MNGQVIIAGTGGGKILATDEGLSFWGGVDPLTGVVIDAHHPICRPRGGRAVAAV
jgi:cis-L-3-hydroxyproline dehydratase